MGVFTSLYRNIKWKFYNKFTTAMIILQPILWLILYSVITSSTMQHSSIENHTAFMLPGLIVLINFSTYNSSGTMNYLMRSSGSFGRILIVPLTRDSIVLAWFFEAVLCTFLEVGIMIALSLLFSVKFSLPLSGYLISISLVFLTPLFVAGLSYGVSILLPNEVIYGTVMNTVAFPVFSLSGALLPMTGITGFSYTTINLSPFTHMTQALHSLTLYGRMNTGSLTVVLLLSILMEDLSFLWACRQLEEKTSLQLRIV